MFSLFYADCFSYEHLYNQVVENSNKHLLFLLLKNRTRFHIYHLFYKSISSTKYSYTYFSCSYVFLMIDASLSHSSCFTVVCFLPLIISELFLQRILSPQTLNTPNTLCGIKL